MSESSLSTADLSAAHDENADVSAAAPDPVVWSPEPDKTQWMAGYPAPIPAPVNLWQAAKSAAALRKNKDDLRIVFEICDALAGNSFAKFFERFAKSDVGKRVLEERVDLGKILTDYDALAKLPAGSLGREYLAYMERTGFQPEGIKDVGEDKGYDLTGEAYPEYCLFFRHVGVLHDVWHALLGYDRDALGEACLLVITREISRNNAWYFIAWGGGAMMKMQRRDLSIFRPLHEARRIGRTCGRIDLIDVEAELSNPVDEVRARYNLRWPDRYHRVPAAARNTLVLPSGTAVA